jgi:hypothetical protein
MYFFLYNIKINLCFVKDGFSGQIFVSLKEVGQTCLILYTMINLVDLDYHKNKNSYYYSFKT